MKHEKKTITLDPPLGQCPHRTFTVRQAAAIIGVSAGKLDKDRLGGCPCVPFRKVGKNVLYVESAIVEYLKSCDVAAVAVGESIKGMPLPYRTCEAQAEGSADGRKWFPISKSTSCSNVDGK